jgi:hypothetical protein
MKNQRAMSGGWVADAQAHAYALPEPEVPQASRKSVIGIGVVVLTPVILVALGLWKAIDLAVAAIHHLLRLFA